MINENELIIANKSYTNKDFASIYPELLELAKKLTNKWDPSTSNESDPGVVLLKLLAFIGDKTNYNIDKNILEAFMPSATQESSMRKLSEMNGYDMGYFNSAETDITFMYRGVMSKSGTDIMKINLNAFDTVITGTDSTVTYVLLENVELSRRGESVTKPAIEGTLKYLRGTDGSFVQANNLDDNNRIYFPERFVAVNGIFITNVDELNNDWDRVDNLNTEVPGQRYFKFGFDSIRNLPYIEFPKDIASIIGSGLDIKYIITQGIDGNVKANLLNKLFNTTDIASMTTWTPEELQTELSVSLSDLVITNNSASVNGRNPETINEAYNNFKKVVGTFTTLVTPRDYANFLYRLLNTSNNYEVSNIQVADRRTDINYSNNVISFNEHGQHVVSNENKADITPFDLCLYPLNGTNDNYDSASYYNSFKRKVIDTEYFKQNLESVKTISHDMKELSNNDIYLYKNYYKLNARITTTKKVSEAEAQSVINNIKLALYKNFNAREIDYGYEIPFDTILSVIQQADTRIKNVSLKEPDLTTKVMLTGTNTSEINYNEFVLGSSEHIKLLAKNIVAGRISLFDYYDDFEFEFFQSSISGTGPIINRISSITTETEIQENSVTRDEGYKLKKNEVVQLVGPSLATKITYPAYVNFWYEGAEVSSGVEYELRTGETLKINYTDTDDNEQNITYSAGTIIRTNFNLKNTQNSGRGTIDKDFNGEPLDMNSLTAKETIEIRDVVSSKLQDTWKCYWLLDAGKNPENILFKENTKEITLSEGESFLYTDDAMTELVILGSGTKLKLEESADSDWVLDRAKLISAEKINDKGLAAFSSIDWKTINFTSNNLTIQEMAFYTLGEGSTIHVSELSYNLTNNPQAISKSAIIKYKENDTSSFVEIPQYNSSSSTDLQWKIHSRLDINMSPVIYQELEQDGDSTQTITLYRVDENTTSTIPITKDANNKTVMNLNIPLQRSGGKDIDLKVTTFSEQSTKIEYLVSAYVYNKEDLPENLMRDEKDGLITYNIKDYENEPITLPLVKLENKDTLIMFYWNRTEVSPATSITISSDSETIKKYNQPDSDNILVPGINLIELTGDAMSELTITIEDAEESSLDTLIIGAIRPINDLNYERFGFTADDESGALRDALLERIHQLSTRVVEDEERDIFYYTASLDKSQLIEIKDLSSPLALFDYNNIANQFTLAEIDIDDRDAIGVVTSSKL